MENNNEVQKTTKVGNEVLADVSILLPSEKDIKDAISAIRQTYEDLVSGDTYPIDEWSPVAKNLKYALRKLGNKC